jgi:hypothetical protein
MIVIQRIERTVRLYQRALCNMQVKHCRGDVSMTKKLFECYDIESLLKQVCGIRVPE